ncbi:MAG: FtsX-like permease family protein [Chitinophagales bacterium]
MNWQWLIKMAWRDSRKNKGRLALFTSSILLGIAALVAINSFAVNLKSQIDKEAKSLLGADLEVKSRQPIPSEVYAMLDSLELEQIREISFASMVYFQSSGETRLVEVRGVEGDYPFYGTLLTEPESAAKKINKKGSSLIDKSLLLQFKASIGDTVRIGNSPFIIDGSILSIPGQSAIRSGVAPPVFIPYHQIPETGLLQKGSRINYRAYVKYPDDFDPAVFENLIKPRLKALDIGFDDVEERKRELGEAYSNLSGFLNLTAFVALLLGCIGVASSAHIYIKSKVNSIAVLRCLGATGNQSLWIYLLQISAMSFVGAALGAILGSSIQFILPQLFESFLPFEVNLSISWISIFQGIVLGLFIAVLFALTSLLNIRKISPLKVLRASYENNEQDKNVYWVYALLILLIYAFSYFQLGNLLRALFFTLGLLLSFGILTALARIVMWLLRRYFPRQSSMVLRQSLSNLYRPNNQTLVLIVSIGLGTALITTLFLSQGLLLEKIKFSSKAKNQPNMVLFDVQDDQKEALHEMTDSLGLPVLQKVPIVNIRLHSLRGMTPKEIKADSTIKVKKWTLDREYRVTYRDSLSESESIVQGEWQGKLENPGDSIFVSLAENIAEDMLAEVGDPIAFNVQGAIIQTYVGSIRKIDWQRMQTNFMVVFPSGVLEKAPKFHVLLTRYDSIPQSALYQRAVVQRFPNISIIDLKLVLSTVDQLLGRVSFVIQFMAFLSIFTGLIVLIGSVLLSKYQRLWESVLLRTLGASQFQILSINALEYFFLGSLASLSGIFIALVSTWFLSWYSFKAIFAPTFLPLLITYLSITTITVLIGLSNSREIINKTPLEILRGE